MKNLNSSLLYFSMFATGLVGGSAFLGCSKSDRTEVTASVKDSYEDSKAFMAKTWADVKGYSFDKRNDFTAGAKSASARFDVEVSKMRADYSEAKASGSRRVAMEELKHAEADYKEKFSAIGTATADTWDSAKKNVTLAWDKLEASYYKARAN